MLANRKKYLLLIFPFVAKITSSHSTLYTIEGCSKMLRCKARITPIPSRIKMDTYANKGSRMKTAW
jgi:hypothetical protein